MSGKPECKGGIGILPMMIGRHGQGYPCHFLAMERDCRLAHPGRDTFSVLYLGPSMAEVHKPRAIGITRSGLTIRRLPLKQVGDAGRPAGLVGGAEAAAGFGLKIFVE